MRSGVHCRQDIGVPAFITKRRFLALSAMGVVLALAVVVGGHEGASAVEPSARISGIACADSECRSQNREVIAMIGDVECGRTTTGYPWADGQPNSHYEIEVASSGQVTGCGQPGDTVEFYIEGRKAAQTTSWKSGETFGVDIWVGPDFISFDGYLSCEGAPCYPCGVSFCYGPQVDAYVGGVRCGSTRPEGWLVVGYTLLVVKSAEQKDGCGSPGAVITFTIDGAPANETSIWLPGFDWLDLSTGTVIWGDHDCSRTIDGSDALRIVRFVAQVDSSAPCLSPWAEYDLKPFAATAKWGDIDCSGDVALLDAISTLREATGQVIDQRPACPPAGASLTPSANRDTQWKGASSARPFEVLR